MKLYIEGLRNLATLTHAWNSAVLPSQFGGRFYWLDNIWMVGTSFDGKGESYYFSERAIGVEVMWGIVTEDHHWVLSFSSYEIDNIVPMNLRIT